MKIRNKAVALIAASALFVTGLTGCGNESTNSSSVNSGSQTANTEPEYTWRLQTIYNLDTMQGVIATQIAEELEKVTNGRLKVEIYPPGGLCQTSDMVTLLSDGAFEMGVSFGNTYSGMIPEGDLEAGLPFAWESADEVYDAFENRGLGDLIREAYDEYGINWYWIAHEPNYNTLTNFKVDSLDDYKGKKIRALGVWASYYQKLGASPTNVSGPEVYQALQLGTIDGAHYGWSSLKDNNLSEVVDYAIEPSAAFISMAILVNQDALAALPEDLRVVVDETCRMASMGFISNTHVVSTKAAVEEAFESGEVTPITLSDSDVETCRKYAVEVWDELAKKSDRMKKGVEILKQQSRDYGRKVDF